MRFRVTVLSVLLVVAPGTVFAQSGVRLGGPVYVNVDVELEYDGVAPGSSHLPPRAHAARNPRRPAQLVTWPGFQMRPDGGGSRFFLQTSLPVGTDVRVEGQRVTVLLRNTRVHVWNNYHPLETRHFNTPVYRAYLQRRGRNLAFVMELRAGVAPILSSEPGENGFHFTMIDFGSGAYEHLPAPLPPPRSARRQRVRPQPNAEAIPVPPPSASTPITHEAPPAPVPQATDSETPPPVQLP